MLASLLLLLSFIGSMHLIAGQSSFEGYRGGPQDAFRHALAAAYITKYISPRAVIFFTSVSEKNLGSDHDQMDRHNNLIGLRIGMEAQDIYQTVIDKVKTGKINSDHGDIITWLPADRWSKFFP